MVPAVFGQLLLGGNFQRIVRPVVNQMNRRPAVFEEQIPAAIFCVPVRHAREQRAGFVLRHAHPCRVAERVRALEIARVRERRRLLPADGVSLRRDRAGLPVRVHPERGRPVRAVQFILELLPRAFVQRRGKNQLLRRHPALELREVRLREPVREITARGIFPFDNIFFGGGKLVPKPLPAQVVLRFRNYHHRRRGLDVAVHRLLRGVVEKCGQRIKILLRDGVVFVIVAHRATGGQPQPRLRGGLRAVAGVGHQHLLVNRAAFTAGDVAAVETAADFLVARRVRQQIAREIFEGELIERHVLIEGGDDPFAVSPHLAVVVEVNPVRVAVARGVQPVARPMLAPLRRREQPVHEFFVGVRRRVVHERRDGFRRRRQAGQVERHAADQRPFVRRRIRF